MNKGYLSIVLHAHLPYVHHPEYDSFFEESWLFEAITECYLPLLTMLDRLEEDQVQYRLTLSISPTLMSMWSNPLLQSRYVRYLQRQVELAEKEILRTCDQPAYQELAQMYHTLFHNTLCRYQEHYQGDLLGAFVRHQQTGKLALITTAATHGFLPLLNISETAVRNQIKVGIDAFNAATGCQTTGFWLPECGYYPGLEKILAEFGIGYFFVDSHGITDADVVAASSVYAPLNCKHGVAVFGRDPASSAQVWSASEGYPGDADYREYYCDIGFDLDLDYIAPYILEDKTRINTGIKYYRVTGDAQSKQIYQPEAALAKARQHAADFIAQRQLQIDALSVAMHEIPPIIVAPFDAELFGHWWFEGPLWLEEVLRLASKDSNGLQTLTCAEYLQLNLPRQNLQPVASSWGENGYSSYWLNDNNDWIYPLIHKAAADLEKMVGDLKGKIVNNLQERALNQAVRSLLLAQASDWPFILKSGTAVEYAKKRITDHLARFNYLLDAIRKNRINERYLTALEIMDDLFPDVDFRDYCQSS